MILFCVAGVQMATCATISETAGVIARYLHKAADRGAQVLLTPEMILVGYRGDYDRRVRDQAIRDILGPACRRYQISLLLGTGTHRGKGKPFNQLLMLNSRGDQAWAYSKVLPTPSDLKMFRKGALTNLKLRRIGGISCGTTICNDFWATPGYTDLPDPNTPKRLAGQGARVIFQAIASGSDLSLVDFHTRRLEDSAARFGLWVVTANAIPGPGRPVNAPSGIVGPDGNWLTRLPAKGERMYVETIRVT
jgi:predicted amidohydrolase